MVSPAERPDGEHAFRLLDSIRRFAAARLQNAGETLGRLERYLLDVLKTSSAMQGAQDRDMRRLDSEQLNLQVVLRWLAREGGPSGPLLQAIGVVWVWLLQLARHRWLTGLLAGRPPAERCEFARLIGHFTGDIDRSLDELNL